MKDTYLLFGLAVGMIAGALVYKHSSKAKEVINKGEAEVKKEINEATKKLDNLTKTKKPQSKKA